MTRSARLSPLLAAVIALAGAGSALAEQRVSFPPQLMPFVYRVLSYSDDRYAVLVKSGFVGPQEAARAIQPLCAARDKAVVGYKPARVVIGGKGSSAMTALSYSVHCR